MSTNNSKYYYSAPQIPQEDLADDPFMDVPSIDQKEDRPGDLFRSIDSLSMDKSIRAGEIKPQFKAGKLDWFTHSLLK